MTNRTIALWVGVVSSILIYLGNAEPPTVWTYSQWIQCGSFVLGLISARFLPVVGKGEDKPPIVPVLILAGVLGLGSVACMPKLPAATLPAAPLTDLAQFAQRMSQAGQIAEQAQKIEIGLYDVGMVPKPAHVTIQQGFLSLSVAVQAGLSLAATTVTPQSAREALIAVSNALIKLDEDAMAIPNQTVRTVIQTMVSTIRVVLQFIPADTAAAVRQWNAFVVEMGGAQ